jgi:hypothetical protein
MTSTLAINTSGVDFISGPPDAGRRRHHDPRVLRPVEQEDETSHTPKLDRHAVGRRR